MLLLPSRRFFCFLCCVQTLGATLSIAPAAAVAEFRCLVALRLLASFCFNRAHVFCFRQHGKEQFNQSGCVQNSTVYYGVKEREREKIISCEIGDEHKNLQNGKPNERDGTFDAVAFVGVMASRRRRGRRRTGAGAVNMAVLASRRGRGG